MLRSVAALFAGFVAMTAVVIIGAIVATALFIPGGLASMRTPTAMTLTPSYLVANIVVSFFAALLGGWITAGVARHSHGIHAATLAAIVLVLGVVQATASVEGQPRWYGSVIPLIGMMGVLAGGAVRLGQLKRAAGSPT